MKNRQVLREAINHVLLKDWDPIGITDIAEAQNEYEDYVENVYGLLVHQASADAIVNYLWTIETQNMGLGHLGKARLNAVAAKLKAAYDTWLNENDQGDQPHSA